jgi:hypothetical protein
MKLKEQMKVFVRSKPSQTGKIRFFIEQDGRMIAVMLWDNDPKFELDDEIAVDELEPLPRSFRK